MATRKNKDMSSQKEDGNALNARTIISKEEMNVIDARSQEQPRIRLADLHTFSNLTWRKQLLRQQNPNKRNKRKF